MRRRSTSNSPSSPSVVTGRKLDKSLGCGPLAGPHVTDRFRFLERESGVTSGVLHSENVRHWLDSSGGHLDSWWMPLFSVWRSSNGRVACRSCQDEDPLGVPTVLPS